MTSHSKQSSFFSPFVPSFRCFFILFFITSKGISVINWNFLSQLPRPVGEIGGGISNAITGTLMLIGIGTAFSVPVRDPGRDFPLREQKRKAGISYKTVCRNTSGGSFHCDRNYCLYLGGCLDGVVLSALRRGGSRSDDVTGHCHLDGARP